MRTRNLLPVVLWMGAAAALSGCDARPAAVAVSGTVTLDGKPLPEGQIVLEPFDKLTGQARRVKVENGQYQLPASQGVPPGKEFRVVITAFRKTGRKYPNANPELSYDEVVQYLPERYNATSNLSITVSAEEAKNQFTFDLTSARR